MQPSIERIRCFVVFILFVLIVAFLEEAEAYVDPGTTGMLSQVLYVLFYGILAVFVYFLRFIKQYVVNAKQFLAKLFTGQQ